MNLHRLRVFAAIAEAGNVTHAAAALTISQPAASKHLSDFEAELGVALCERLPRGVRLTEAGRALHTHAQQLFAIESAAETQLRALASGSHGTLSVGASTTIGSYLVPALFGAFRRAYPNVKLDLQIANTETIQGQLLDGRLDLALTEGLAGAPDLHVEVVTHDTMRVITAPGHRWADRTAISLDELANIAVVMRERGSGTRAVIEAELAKRGLTIEPVMALGSTEAVKHAVAAGLGVGIVSELCVALELETGRLVSLDVEEVTLRRALHLVRVKGRPDAPIARNFVQLVRERFQAPGDVRPDGSLSLTV